jgi:hypothetical protein
MKNPVRSASLFLFSLFALSSCAQDDSAPSDQSVGDASINGGAETTASPPLPNRINGADNVALAASLCRTLRIATDGMGVYRVEQIDYEPRTEDEPSRLFARLTLSLQESLVAGTPERVEALMPVTLAPGGDTVTGELSIGAGDEFILLVHFQHKPEFEIEIHNAMNPLLNHLTFIPMVDGEWRHPSWSGCAASTEELLSVVEPMFAYLANWSEDSQEEFECPGDRFALTPGSGSLQADCGR